MPARSYTVTNPVGSLEGAAKYAAIGAVDRAITPKPKKRQRKAKGEATPAVAIHPATQASKDELVAFLNEHLSDEVSRQLKPMPWESKADDVAGAAYAAAYSYTRATVARRGLADPSDQYQWARDLAQEAANQFRLAFMQALAATHPVISPDGRWWWNGERWRPVVHPPGE